jgi:hypothetical protein
MAGSRSDGDGSHFPPILGHSVLRRAEFQGRSDTGSAQVPMDLGKEGMRKTAALVIDISECIQ